MKISISKRGFLYVSRSLILCILSAFLGCLVGVSCFFIHLLCIIIFCLFVHLFRDNKCRLDLSSQVVIPSDGKIIRSDSVEKHFLGFGEEYEEIRIKSGIFDRYTKYSPITGKVQNAGYSKSKEIGRFLFINIENELGLFTLLIRPTFLFEDAYILNHIEKDVYVHIGDPIVEAPFSSESCFFIPKEVYLNPLEYDRICLGGVTKVL